MKHVLIYFPLLVILCAGILPAQSPGPWARSGIGTLTEQAFTGTIDDAGNSYLAGYFLSASLTFGSTTLFNANEGARDWFLVKYDPSGTVLWAESVGDSGNETMRGLTADASGNTYSAGYFSSDSITVGSTVLTNSNPGSLDFCVVKRDPNGTVLWAKSFQGQLSDDLAIGIDVDVIGNTYIAGFFSSDTLFLGPDTLFNAVGASAFNAKLDVNGNAVWARNVDGVVFEEYRDVVVDAVGNSYVAGEFRDSITVGPFIMGSEGPDWDMFVVKYDPNGAALWAKKAGGSGSEAARGVAVDGSGNVYVVGSFVSDTLVFGADTLFHTAPDIYDDVYVVKYNSSGTVQWAQGVGGTSFDDAWSIDVDSLGNSYIAGKFFSPTIDFGTGTLINNGGYDLFVTKYDPNGTALWVRAEGGTGNELPWNIDVDKTGNVFVAGQFSSPNLIIGADTLTSTGYDGILIKLSPFSQIASVSDIPGDQGGQVRLSWYGSALDDVDAAPKITSYGVWRKVPAGLMAAGYKAMAPPIGMAIAGEDLSGYDYIQSVPAVQASSYNVVVPTLEDSSDEGTPHFSFLVTAHTADVEMYFASFSDSGYSVDNLAPIPPAGLLASVEAGPMVELTWDTPADPDVGSYSVYRSTDIGFTPEAGNKIGSSGTTGFTDNSPPAGVISYYRIIAVDVHDNGSSPSDLASAAVPVDQQFGVEAKWNIVSVPLTMTDYSKTVLFPTATTGAFAYDGGYFGYVTLENGRGYWMKFSGGETISHAGLERTEDTIDVAEGWNMLGSLSSSIAASNVGSVPGGIVTSNFYAYDAGYSASPTLEPGSGYWVKVSQAGQLVLSSMVNIPATNRIRIEDTGELPPSPPDEVTSEIPDAYSLAQNYPNPFNPATSINYALPLSDHVTLTVYNMLGQEVAVLVDEVQDAGFKTLSFDASNLPSGMYTYRITAGTFADVKKMLLLK